MSPGLVYSVQGVAVSGNAGSQTLTRTSKSATLLLNPELDATRIWVLRPWMPMYSSACPYGVTELGATTGIPDQALPIRLIGNCDVVPCPSCRAFCSTVRSSVSIARSPPVIAQRKMSIVWLVAQFR